MMRFNPNEYQQVDVRINEWWSKHPQARIETKLLDQRKEGQFIVWAAVYKDQTDPVPVATGLAEESLGGKGANRDAALENAETSAIGRALANAGLQGSGKRPSLNEMQKSERIAARNATEQKLQGSAPRKVQTLTKVEKEKLGEIAVKHNVTSIEGKTAMRDALLEGKSFQEIDAIAEVVATSGVDGLKNILGAKEA